MPDPTNDIDALLEYLTVAVNQHWIKIPRGVAADYHAALTALVAERDALRERVAELEAKPPADRDRELRERMVDSALRGVGALSMLNEETAKFVGRQAVWMVDGALAAMRKGGGA